MDIYQRLAGIERFRVELELNKQFEELLARHPEVQREGLPQEAVERFKRGGVSLREAYLLACEDAPRPKRQLSRAERQAMRAYGLDETALDE